jgi:hypothetical protein
MDAREFVVSTWTCCRQTPQPTRDPDFAGTQNQARHRGVLLFGYFLLDKQEKVTRPPLRGTKLAKSQQQKPREADRFNSPRMNRENRTLQSPWIPACAGMTKVRGKVAKIKTILTPALSPSTSSGQA